MGQVPAERPDSGPAPYGFVGDGRLSRHWRHYFTSLGIPWKLWSRRMARANGKPGVTAAAALADCPVILLAVSDDAIAPVLATLRAEGLDDRRFVHFCGGRSFEGAFGAHPLMSFATTLYEPAFYRDIPVFVDLDDAHPEPVAEFQRLFQAGGLLDAFFQANLAGLVDTGGPVWTWRTDVPAARGLSQRASGHIYLSAGV